MLFNLNSVCLAPVAVLDKELKMVEKKHEKILNFGRMLTVGGVIYLFSCTSVLADSAGLTVKSRPLLHTFVQIKLSSPKADRVIDAAFQEMTRVNGLLNNYDPASEVSRINAAAGHHFVEISFETAAVLQSALRVAKLSDGAFDFTVGPLLKVWGFSTDQPGRDGDGPSAEELARAKSLVGYDQFLIRSAADGSNNPFSAKLAKKGMYLDVGAFSKGYVADCAMALIRKNGVQSALVTAGGTVVAMGVKPDRSCWTIGIRHPRKAGGMLAAIELENRAVSTSGDYEKFYRKNNKRLTHIIDPRTALPVDRHQSVTVIAKTGFESDALATALFVMDTVRGMALVNSLPRVEALVIDHAGNIFMSRGWPEKNITY